MGGLHQPQGTALREGQGKGPGEEQHQPPHVGGEGGEQGDLPRQGLQDPGGLHPPLAQLVEPQQGPRRPQGEEVVDAPEGQEAPRAWGAGIQGFRASSSRVSKTPSPPGTWLATPLTAATRNSRRKWGRKAPREGAARRAPPPPPPSPGRPGGAGPRRGAGGGASARAPRRDRLLPEAERRPPGPGPPAGRPPGLEGPPPAGAGGQLRRQEGQGGAPQGRQTHPVGEAAEPHHPGDLQGGQAEGGVEPVSARPLRRGGPCPGCGWRRSCRRRPGRCAGRARGVPGPAGPGRRTP